MDRVKVAPRWQTRQSVKKDHDSHPDNQERQVVPDLEYIKRAGDKLTEFVPTEQDLVDLADMLVENVIGYRYQARICADEYGVFMWGYTEYRLRRIVDYLPELESKIKKKLQRGFKESDAAELQDSDPEYIKRAGDNLTKIVITKQDLVVLANALVDYIVNYEHPEGVCLCKSDLPTRTYTKIRLDLMLAEFSELKSEFEAKVRRGYKENDVAEFIEDMEAEARHCDETETKTRLQ